MASFGKHFKVDTGLGLSNPNAIKKGNRYRITVLSDRLIRLEYAPDGKFNDNLTDLVVNRRFNVPNFKVQEDVKSTILKQTTVEVKTVEVKVKGIYNQSENKMQD